MAFFHSSRFFCILTSVFLSFFAAAQDYYVATADVAGSSEAKSPASASADTIALSEPEYIEEFQRELETVEFVPKGQWVAGLSLSFSQSNQNNYQFLIFENISGDTYSFKVSPMVCYIFKPDMGVGGKFGYSRSLMKLEKADVVLDSETSYSGDHVYSLSHSYWGMAIMRNYFSLGRSKRFGFFSELQLQIGGGQSKLTNGVGSQLSGTYMRNFNLDIGLAPGMAVFLNNYTALEVNVGVLGFSYNHNKQISDRIYVSNIKSKTANFKINLFSITFGCAFYL